MQGRLAQPTCGPQLLLLLLLLYKLLPGGASVHVHHELSLQGWGAPLPLH